MQRRVRRAGVAATSAALTLLAASQASAAHRWTFQVAPSTETVGRFAVDARKVVDKRRDVVDVFEPQLPADPPIRFAPKGADPKDAFVFPGVAGVKNVVASEGRIHDDLVIAVLLVARDHFPKETLTIESDIDWVAWREGRLLYEQTFGHPARNPGIAERAPGFYPGQRTVLPTEPTAKERFSDPRTRPWGIVIAACIGGLILLLLVPTKQE